MTSRASVAMMGWAFVAVILGTAAEGSAQRPRTFIEYLRFLDNEERDLEALGLVEEVVRDPEPEELRGSRDLVLALDLVRHLDAPGSEVLWFVAGLPLLVGGVVALPTLAVWDELRNNGGSFDRTGMDWGYALAGAAAVIGVVLCVVGDARHTQDPDRRAFESRRHPLMLTLHERAREARRHE